ncbi:MAG: PqqD family protein [Theionarchaea archaeon]|nr:PqqD family protein [Theionarchaea archaeon]
MDIQTSIEFFHVDTSCNPIIWLWGFLGCQGKVLPPSNNKDVLHSVGGATFTLGNYSRIFREMAHFDVKSIQLTPGEDLGIWVDYTVKNGLTGFQAKNVSENFEKRLKNIYPYNLFTRKVGREYLLLFMDTLGRKGIIESYTEKEEGKGKEEERRRKNEITVEKIKNPRLSDHVRIARFNHDFLGEENLRKDTFIVFNILNEKLIEVSETAYFILDLCDGVHELQAIAEWVSDTYDQSYDHVLDDTRVFILEMLREGVIAMSAL